MQKVAWVGPRPPGLQGHSRLVPRPLDLGGLSTLPPRPPHPNLPQASKWALARPQSWEVTVLFSKGGNRRSGEVTCPKADKDTAQENQGQNFRDRPGPPTLPAAHQLLHPTSPQVPGTPGKIPKPSRVRGGAGRAQCPQALSRSYPKSSPSTAVPGGLCPQTQACPRRVSVSPSPSPRTLKE